LSRDTSLFMASSNSDYDSGWSMHNAASEWQARSSGLRSIVLVAACPLEGLVRLPFMFPQFNITFPC
jgi:hypothetical protein